MVDDLSTGTELVDAQPAAGKRQRQVAVKAAPAPSTPMDLIAMAVQRGDSVETIDKLMALAERLDKIQAQKAFVAAMARFKANPPRIEKTRTAKVRSDKGNFEYKFASLADVCTGIVAGLADVGISHKWTTLQNNGQVAVTCTLTHELGHSESTMLAAGLDTSGAKNSLQALGSTTSYLERYTLLSICGIAVDDESDDDGNGLSDEERNSVGDAVKQSRSRNQPKPADVAAQQRGNAPAPSAELLQQARDAAAGGTAHFGPYWRGLKQEERDALAPELSNLQARAGAAKGK